MPLWNHFTIWLIQAVVTASLAFPQAAMWSGLTRQNASHSGLSLNGTGMASGGGLLRQGGEQQLDLLQRIDRSGACAAAPGRPGQPMPNRRPAASPAPRRTPPRSATALDSSDRGHRAAGAVCAEPAGASAVDSPRVSDRLAGTADRTGDRSPNTPARPIPSRQLGSGTARYSRLPISSPIASGVRYRAGTPQCRTANPRNLATCPSRSRQPCLPGGVGWASRTARPYRGAGRCPQHLRGLAHVAGLMLRPGAQLNSAGGLHHVVQLALHPCGPKHHPGPAGCPPGADRHAAAGVIAPAPGDLGAATALEDQRPPPAAGGLHKLALPGLRGGAGHGD